MTSDERKTLEALHDAAMTSIPAMNAIRAALAEVDALTARDGERFLLWRGLDHPDDACDKCGGAGNRAYGSTAGWRGGIGGQAITTDVCDACWGSGNKSRPGANLRKIEGEARSLRSQVDALTQQVATLTTERDKAHSLAVESKRKMDAAYAHADLIQSEITTATDDCPHPSDTWTTCSACHLKAMRERDAACAQVADLEHADECHAKFYARLCDALHVPEQRATRAGSTR